MRYTFDTEDILKQVHDFIRSVGIEPADTYLKISIDGNIHTFATTDDKQGQKSGRYCIYSDGWPAGWVQDWRKGIKESWKYDTSGLNEEQRTYFDSEEFRKKCEENERRKKIERQKKKQRASEDARIRFDTMKPADDSHPYLVRKHVYAYNIRVHSETGDLAIPLRDINGHFKSMQWIPADKNKSKMFFPGADLDGAFFSIGLPPIDRKEYDGVLLIGEGYATMAKVYELTEYPCVAAMSCHKLMDTARIMHSTFPQAKIIIIGDNDIATEQRIGRNPGIDHARNVVKFGYALGISYPQDIKPDEGSDWDDYALAHGDENTARLIKADITKALTPKSIREIIDKSEIINVQDLMTKVFQPIKWAVPGFMPSGLTVLGGGPKIGKSSMALQISLAITSGGKVFRTIDVQRGDVLYLALEDTQRRLQDRVLASDFSDCNTFSALDFVTKIPPQHEGGLEYINWWLDKHENARLVIIDTLQRFRKKLSGKDNMYGEDYDVITQLKNVADNHNVAVLVIHHLRKMSAKEELAGDWINQLSGSTGISGSADTILVLKRDRSSTNGILRRTGRDVEEKDFSMTLDGFDWILEGEAEDLTTPTWKKQILDYLKEHDSVTPSDLATSCGLFLKTAQKNLARLQNEGVIKKTGYGKYSLSGSQD